MKRIVSCFLLLTLIPSGSIYGKSRNTPEELIYGIPQLSDIILSRCGFSLGYSNSQRQALWVCYILSADKLVKEQTKRSNTFRIDPAVKYQPVKPSDYTKTGYDRGHLASAADMAYSVETMTNSFFMSNISPQIPGCNRGIWKRLEKQVRMWAIKEQKLCVITGPIFQPRAQTLGKTDIPIPAAFYKVILDMTPPMKMIGFIVPNETTKRRLHSFVVTVDEVEKITGYDFFRELPDEIENKLESNCNFMDWELPALKE